MLGLIEHHSGKCYSLVAFDITPQKGITRNYQTMGRDFSEALLTIRAIQRKHRQVRQKMRRLALPVPNKRRRTDHQRCARQSLNEGQRLHRLAKPHLIREQAALPASRPGQEPPCTIDLIGTQFFLHRPEPGARGVRDGQRGDAFISFPL